MEHITKILVAEDDTDINRLICELLKKNNIIQLPPDPARKQSSALEHKVGLLTLGADDYMTKPFEPEELLARVFACLRRGGKISGTAASDCLSFRKLRLFPDALGRIFANLLQNSIRYAKSRLVVSLDTNPPACSLCFRFSNDILPEQKPSDPARLFERFYMQEPSRTQGGTDPGLTIARRLTEGMGGTILAACETKEGTDYLTITLLILSKK